VVAVKKEYGPSPLCSCHYRCYSPFWIYSCENTFGTSQKVLMHVLEEAGFTKDSDFTVPDFMKVKALPTIAEEVFIFRIMLEEAGYT
jgi:hypothetical protein